MRTEDPIQVLHYGDRQIPYRLVYSERKRLRITVRPDLSVMAMAPSGCNEMEARKAIRSKAPWIIRQLSFFEEFHPLPAPRNYLSGETFVYLGRQYRLKVETGAPEPAKLKGGFLSLTVWDKTDAEAIRRAVNGWYRRRADIVFRRYLSHCLDIARRHGISEPTLTIRDMRTRWGSCSVGGRITLNLKLIHTPVHCIEYVIMHELCHLAHHDHSPRFYRLLTRCMPDWKKRRELLRRVVL